MTKAAARPRRHAAAAVLSLNATPATRGKNAAHGAARKAIIRER